MGARLSSHPPLRKIRLLECGVLQLSLDKFSRASSTAMSTDDSEMGGV